MINFQKILDQFKGLNAQDVGTWPIAPRIVSLVVIFLAVLIGGWFLVWEGQLAELETGQEEEQRLKTDYRNKLQQAINLETLKRQKELVAQFVQTLEKQLPSKAEMEALLSDINQAGIGRGLQFELFRPGGVTVRDYYAELPITIRVSGSYHDIGAFTSDIANLPRIVTLNNLRITAAGNGLALDAIAKTFRYLDPSEVTAQKKTKGPQK
jgi:type IV pilus assembly protein PilO